MDKIIIERIKHSLQTNTLEELIAWVKQTAKITKGQSGMFGVGFKELIPYLESLAGEVTK